MAIYATETLFVQRNGQCGRRLPSYPHFGRVVPDSIQLSRVTCGIFAVFTDGRHSLPYMSLLYNDHVMHDETRGEHVYLVGQVPHQAG